MNFTKLAVLFATSFADCTKCRLATGLSVFEDAALQALHSAAVCFAITVAADKTCKKKIFLNKCSIFPLKKKNFLN